MQIEGKFRSAYGVKIRNIEASIIDEYNRGIRKFLSYSKAVVPNSLLLDYLLDHGLPVRKDNSTRSLIGVSFSFSTNDFEGEFNKLEKKLEEATTEKDREFYTGLKENCLKNKDLYIKKSKAELREQFYTEGFSLSWGDEVIHYLPLYRSAGRAKLGACTFIDARLYPVAIDYLRMGIELPEENCPIVEIQAYSSLVASSIKDRVVIDPEEVLIVEDVESIFKTNVITIEVDEDQKCYTTEVEDYPLKNILFDGQGLIDSSLFEEIEWAEGYVLLRQHFTKLAAFHCDIQKFFRDYYREEYETATARDMFGREIPVKQIKLITTDNAIKWKKFGVTFEQWAERIRTTNHNNWGIVKSVYKSKMGDVQRMSYQMVNALDLKSIDSVITGSKEYIKQLKTNDEVFIDFLSRNGSYANDYEVLVDLYRYNPKITQSSYFRERRWEIIRNYLNDFKSGRIIQNADNLVICGSPYAMLLQAVGDDPTKDPTFGPEDGAIQVWTERFRDEAYLASFRSPFNSQNNLCHLHNVYHPIFDEYFHVGKLTIFVNMLGTDFQARNNGSDQDSDSIYVTDQEDIVRFASQAVIDFPTIDNCIPKETNSYTSSMVDFAAVDTKIASANMAIGVSSNLAQLCLTYGFNSPDPKYKEYACILAVLAQVAIDNAKRSFAIDLNAEILRIKKDLDIPENGLPLFWFYIKRKGRFAKQNKNSRRIMKGFNPGLVCPMNILCEINFPRFRSRAETIPIGDFLIQKTAPFDKKQNKRVERFIEKYAVEFMNEVSSSNFDRDLLDMDFDELLSDIRRIYFKKDLQGLMVWLLRRGFQAHSNNNKEALNSNTYRYRPVLLKTLWSLNKELFLSCFKTAEDLQ